MAELSSLDFHIIADELQFLSGGKIQKIYHEGKELHLSVYVRGKGTCTLVTGDGKFFVTSCSLKHRQRPTGFCMFLRKRLSGQWIDSLKQVGFERILVLETGDYKIYFELFRNGNTIVTDKNDKIISVMSVQMWKGRALKANEDYKLPPVSFDTLKLDEAEFCDTACKSSKKIISVLARDLSLGGNYAEDILAISKVDMDKSAKDLSVSEKKKVFKAVSSMLSRKKEPQIVVENEKYVDISSFFLMKYKDFDSRKFADLNLAVDEFYVSKMEIEDEKMVISKQDKQKGSLEHRLKMQEDSLKLINKKIDDCNKKAEAIYSNFKILEEIILQVNDAGASKGWDFVAKKVKSGQAGKVKSIDLKTKIMSVDVGMAVNVYFEKPLNFSSEMYYKKARKVKDKIPGVEKSVDMTQKNIYDMGDRAEVKPKVRVERRVAEKRWYDKFRHFVSSKGFLVLGGKDATSNEILVKKHMDKDDVVFHADVAGSSFVVIKSEGKKIDDKTLAEAAQFAAVYSKGWKMKVGTVDVYWVTPDQVSKEAPSGEFIQKGSFMVRGKKNWMKPELRLSFALVDDEILCGPELMVSVKTRKSVTVAPGYKKSKDLAKDIRTKLFSVSSVKEQDVLRTIPIDSIQKFIPSGTGEVLK